MPVNFKHFRCNNRVPSLTLENVFQQFGAWSGIHDYAFEDTYADDTAAVSYGGSGYGGTMLGLSILPNFAVQYTFSALGAGIRVTGGSLDWVIGLDTSGRPFVLTAAQGILAMRLPTTYSAPATCEMVFRQIRVNDREDEVWFLATLYVNGKVAIAYSEVGSATISAVDVGLYTYTGVSNTFTNIRIPELTETAEFGTLDPGEVPLAGLQRTMEGRYLKYFMRWDGSLRAWKKKARDVTLTVDHLMGLKRIYDLPALVTHARMMGAWVWAEAINEDLVRQYGHRFFEDNNSMLLTEEECVVESVNTIRRSEEAAFGIDLQAPFQLFLEPEDRITADDDDWLIDGYSLDVGEGRITASISARKYAWET